MGPIKNNRRERRPRLIDRLELRLSTHKYVDGLWIGTFEQEPASVLSRVEEALGLIKSYDRQQYDRVTRDLERVWVRTLCGNPAEFNESAGACELDVRFVLAATSSRAIIASTVVHEATHARLLQCGIGYEENLRAKVEAVCFRRELAFAKKLPNDTEVRGRAERMLELAAGNEYWTNTAVDQQYVEGAIEMAHYVGVPIWLARVALTVRGLRTAVRRQLRRLLGR
jgi:hypothetical protein